MGEPTREDAQLMLQIAQWGTSMGVTDAWGEIFSDDFDPYEADATEPSIRNVLTFCETIGTLVKRDLLSKELVEDWLWIDGLWGRVGPAAIKQREKLEEPRLYENFEAMTSEDAPDVKAALKEAQEKREEEERKRKEEEERKKKEEEEQKKKEEEEAKAKEEEEEGEPSDEDEGESSSEEDEGEGESSSEEDEKES
jgi:hypothetical protein